MSLVLSIPGELETLRDLLTTQNFTLKLYKNDYIPTKSSVAGDFTEVVGFGYSSKTLNSGNWTFSGSNPTLGTQPPQAFTFSGAAGLVYGYFVVRSNGDLAWSERFDTGPFNIQSSSTIILLTPTISGR